MRLAKQHGSLHKTVEMKEKAGEVELKAFRGKLERGVRRSFTFKCDLPFCVCSMRLNEEAGKENMKR